MKTWRIRLAFLLSSVALLSGGASAQVVTEFYTPFIPFSITGGFCSNGIGQCLWFTAESRNVLERMTTDGFRDIPTSALSGTPYDITTGPCGNGTQCLWFPELVPAQPVAVLRIGRYNPNTGTLTEFGGDLCNGGGGGGIAVGPDGNIWFTDGCAQIWRMTPGNGTLTAFSNGITAAPFAITAGPDGNLWFTESGLIGRITPTGTVTEFSAPVAAPAVASAITTGPDGNLWYTYGNLIGNIKPDGSTPNLFGAGIIDPFAGISSITAGPDGNLWFTEQATQRIGRIKTDGTIAEFSAGISGNPVDITAGPDGALWFAEGGINRIGRISTSGSNTAVGSDVTLDFRGGDADFPGGVSVTFTAVTSAGDTELTTSGPCPAAPAGFSVGTPAICYGLTTTAAYTPPVQVCINYSDISFGPGPIALLHYDGSVWTDVTTSVDTNNQIVCGEVSSLSPFIVASGSAAPTATATPTGTSTPAPTATGTVSATPTPAAIDTATPTATPTATSTATQTPTVTPTVVAPPLCDGAAASASTLWPPNHEFISEHIGGVTSTAGPVAITITDVRQDEPTLMEGSGHTCPDGEGIGTSTARVRAERQGGSNGRVYHIDFTATDANDQSCSGTVLVCVPHDQQEHRSCVDEGALFDSTKCQRRGP